MGIQTNIVAKSGNPPISYNILRGESNEFPKNIILDANHVNDITSDLQELIDKIGGNGGVVDIVVTKSNLDEYDTSKLSNGDILKVLVDETHDNSASYYKWDEELETFDYIGKEDAYYTKQEIDNMFGDKENKTIIDARNTQISTLTAEVGKYYRFNVPVETLAIILPSVSDTTSVKSIVFYMTGGATPAITFTSTNNVYYSNGFAIESGKTYEVNALYNGVAWVVASVEIVTSNS